MNTYLKNSFIMVALLTGGFFVSVNAQRRDGGNEGGSRSNSGSRSFNRSSGEVNRQRSFNQPPVFNRQSQNNGSLERRIEQRNNFPQDNRMLDNRNRNNPTVDNAIRNRSTIDNTNRNNRVFDNNRGNTNNISRDNNRDFARDNISGTPRSNRTIINNNVRINNNSRYGYGRSDYYNRYSYVPRRHSYIGAPRYSVLPRTYLSINFGGYPYYYNGGSFYSYFDGFYEPVFAPIGIRIRALPVGYYPIYVGSRPYYYYDGIYYDRYNNSDEYEVVDAPVGAQISVLPKGATTATVNGEKFYEFNGTYYKEDVNTNNEIVYTVVGKYGEINNTDNQSAITQQASQLPQVGDVVSKLPENSKQVTINNETLYLTPDSLYLKTETINNTTVYRVVGKSN